jgi:hypothetical protein
MQLHSYIFAIPSFSDSYIPKRLSLELVEEKRVEKDGEEEANPP